MPAGFVVVDPMTLADPVLFVREGIAGMQAADATRAAPDVLDLRLGATMGSVLLSFDQVAELFRAGRGRRPTETVKTSRLLIAVVRRDEMLHLAKARRLHARSSATAAIPPPIKRVAVVQRDHLTGSDARLRLREADRVAVEVRHQRLAVRAHLRVQQCCSSGSPSTNVRSRTCTRSRSSSARDPSVTRAALVSMSTT